MNRKKFLTVLATILPLAFLRNRVTAAVLRENGTIASVDQFDPSSGTVARDSGGVIQYRNSPVFQVNDRVSFFIDSTLPEPVATELQPITPPPSSGDGSDGSDAGDGGDAAGGDGGADGN